MFIVEKSINMLRDLIPFASLEDEITVDGDIHFVEKLLKTISLQNELVKGSNMGVQQIDPKEYDGSVESVNSIINVVNENFMKIAEGISNGEIDFRNFNENLQVNVYFSDFDRAVKINIDNKDLVIDTGNLKYKYSADTDQLSEVTNETN